MRVHSLLDLLLGALSVYCFISTCQSAPLAHTAHSSPRLGQGNDSNAAFHKCCQENGLFEGDGAVFWSQRCAYTALLGANLPPLRQAGRTPEELAIYTRCLIGEAAAKTSCLGEDR
jgi:hypothetical protein